MSVEERIGRINAILLAMDCVASHADEMAGAADACAWLKMIAQDDLKKISASLGTDALNRDC